MAVRVHAVGPAGASGGEAAAEDGDGEVGRASRGKRRGQRGGGAEVATGDAGVLGHGVERAGGAVEVGEGDVRAFEGGAVGFAHSLLKGIAGRRARGGGRGARAGGGAGRGGAGGLLRGVVRGERAVAAERERDRDQEDGGKEQHGEPGAHALVIGPAVSCWSVARRVADERGRRARRA